jgi:hypothetical protein
MALYFETCGTLMSKKYGTGYWKGTYYDQIILLLTTEFSYITEDGFKALQ